jgi:hypothetical protein
MTIVWAVLISFAISYVLTSMAAETMVISEVLIFAGILSVIIFLLGDVALKEKKN